MTPEELAEGNASCYRRLFSTGSIWRRRPLDPRAVAPYLAMSVLYKRANPLWTFLIRRRLVAAAWRPLVEATRRRHLSFRQRLAARPEPDGPYAISAPLSARSSRRTERWQWASSAQ